MPKKTEREIVYSGDKPFVSLGPGVTDDVDKLKIVIKGYIDKTPPSEEITNYFVELYMLASSFRIEELIAKADKYYVQHKHIGIVTALRPSRAAAVDLSWIPAAFLEIRKYGEYLLQRHPIIVGDYGPAQLKGMPKLALG